ncbi:MAG TPA: DUF5317 family protein [Mycobacteriales bacterium]|nr:DUF5317 family protein [Mycobacteriales bacterium]
MGLTVVALVAAVGVALLLGGRWSRLSALRLRSRGLVPIALLVQAGGALFADYSDARTAYAAGLALSAVLVAVFCARNLGVRGIGLVTLGLTANAVVVAANGSMPVSIVAAYHARVPILSIAQGSDPRHEIAGVGTRLRPLGDVVPVPLPVRPEVVSVGDVLVAAGLAELLVLGMMGSGSRHRGSRNAESLERGDHGEEGAQASGA